MISHDATLVAFELSRCQGGECSWDELKERCADTLRGSFDEAVDNLKALGLVTSCCKQAANSKAANSSSYKLATKAMSSSKLANSGLKQHHHTTYILLKAANSSSYKQLPSEAEVLRVVGRAVDRRNFHSNYQAVVSGKRARRDAIVEAGKALNPADRADYWRAIGRMDEEQQNAYRNRLAQPAAHRS